MAEHWFRVLVTLPCAIETMPEDESNPPRGNDSRRLTGRARAAVARINARREPEVREVLSLLLDAMEVLEDEVIGLRSREELSARRLSLNPQRMQLGGDGMTLFWRSTWPVGQRVRVHLALPGKYGSEAVHTLTGRVRGAGEDRTITEIAFERSTQIEAIVAFCFEVQRRERREQLDSLGSNR